MEISTIHETVNRIYALNEAISPEKMSAREFGEYILKLNTCVNHLATCVAELARKLNLQQEFGGYW